MASKGKNGILVLILGALLVVGGLFFFRSSPEMPELKPSEVDFTKGNHPQAGSAAATTETAKVERAPMDLNPPAGLSEVDAKQWAIFQKVVTSRNDNDPRVDQEMKNLSPQMHEGLRKKYHEIPAENRNSRGLVAFLIARDLQSTDDVRFLTSIYQETPCLSMSDCSRPEAADPHTESTIQTSLNYPQLAGLYQLEQKLERSPELLQNPDMRQEISNLLREARQFPGSALQKRAEDIQKKYGL